MPSFYCRKAPQSPHVCRGSSRPVQPQRWSTEDRNTLKADLILLARQRHKLASSITEEYDHAR
jgi:hypothetical protein